MNKKSVSDLFVSGISAVVKVGSRLVVAFSPREIIPEVYWQGKWESMNGKCAQASVPSSLTCSRLSFKDGSEIVGFWVSPRPLSKARPV